MFVVFINLSSKLFDPFRNLNWSYVNMKFSLFPLKKSEAVVEQPTDEVLTELIVAGKITAAFV